MSVSGVTTFNQTRDQISTDAMNLLGVYNSQDTPTANDLSFCSNILNKMVKAWEAQGVHLWTRKESALFLTLNQQRYTITTTGDVAGDDPVFTTLTNSASGTSLTVGATTGMSVNDNIGIKLDNNTIQWTTVSSIIDSVTVSINASLTSAASAGNNVFCFTNRTNNPLEITSARFYTASGYERPIEYRGRDEFMQIPNKSTSGKANQWTFSPKVSDNSFYIWPVADDVGDCVRFTYLRRLDDFVSGTDNPDLPQEWLEPITYNLCLRIAPAFGISTAKLNPDITLIAQQSLAQMTLWDSDSGATRIVPNYSYDY